MTTPLTLLDPPPEEPDNDGLAAPDGFPSPPAEAAYHGLAGQIIDQIAPHTEADPVALLAQLLVAFGASVGRGAWFAVEATRHHANEFLVLVGDSAKARKGSSWDHVRRLVDHADPTLAARTLTGLSSGEGLIWAVRDPTDNDPGVGDRRLLIVEPEFASVLKTASRDISTLSPTLRSAWDGRPLAILTRNAPARASQAHVAVIGHITSTELQHHVGVVELANGLLNRFLLVACRRVRLLPDGGHPDPLHGTGHDRALALATAAARDAGQLRFTEPARALWHDAYRLLAQPQPGVAGQLAARAEAHTTRLALAYALLDRSPAIGPDHLQAALALQDYATRSAAWALEPDTGDPIAEQIHAALLRSPDGLTRTQLRDLLNRNIPARRLDQALANLSVAAKADRKRILTAGRPAVLWTAKR
ncbi:MAG: DUF3987 domain-containing protein [Thermoleophilaceae bacterium]